ncbi:DUF4307 domain-containing protein [Kibdelosporangium philippinense]|uniref:DUF4307 domain-containing protein n=1 Tax=Kibdelosporangium philippinense TaxID=211113 RepID=A0ABS8ZLE6_9PSEU|nr:DUF4307 domain-containing protein [Kibdelosporangium philippinense]MCE7008611.1 DUF4307 domain-containing protein [Kibdelosporangium philippinense]
MESRVTLPEGRYGSSRTRQLGRGRKWVLTGVGLLLAVAIAFVAYRNLGSAPIEAESTAFSPVGADAVRITFNVTRDEPSRAAVCVVRARVLDGSEGGRKEVLVPPGESTISTVIKSSADPVTADVFGCSYQVPPYLSTEARPTE